MAKMVSSPIPPIINRKVAAAMIALSVYGLFLIIVSNNNININPVYVLTSIKNRYYVYSNATREGTTSAMSTARLLELETKNSSNASAVTSNATRSIKIHSTLHTASHTASMSAYSSRGPHNTSTVSTTVSQSIDTTLDSERTGTPPGKPILTMFSTFKGLSSKDYIYKNTIRNWERLKPWVQPVLFYLPGETSLVEFAREHGWDALEVPKFSDKKVPVLRHMFMKAREKYSTEFYCYTNGDILFDDGLIETLKALEGVTKKMKQVLIVGRRTNFKLANGQKIDKFETIKSLGKKGQLFGTNAQDYFITTTHGYPWETIPDFVVGRVGYDNWLVVTALVKKMVVIDTTKTILALHQTGSDGNFAGHTKKSSGDTYINYHLAGKRFDYSLGHVTCGQFYTERTQSNPPTVTVKERQKNGCEKMYRKRHLDAYIKLPKRR